MTYTKADAQKATRKWKAKVYKRVVMDIPKERAEEIRQAAEQAGQSMTAFIMQAVAERIGNNFTINLEEEED